MTKRPRKELYGKLFRLSRQLLVVWQDITNEIKSEGAGKDAPQRPVSILDDAIWDRIDDWEDGQLEADAPEPKTKLEHLLQKHHRLLWAAQNHCDEIEKQLGEISPLLDLRHTDRPKRV
jgi:hypothetical protein